MTDGQTQTSTSKNELPSTPTAAPTVPPFQPCTPRLHSLVMPPSKNPYPLPALVMPHGCGEGFNQALEQGGGAAALAYLRSLQDDSVNHYLNCLENASSSFKAQHILGVHLLPDPPTS
jgi:hypothetical protein